MIRKIRDTEYSKRVERMQPEERRAFGGRVGEWLRSEAPLLTARVGEPGARIQNAVQSSAGWNDRECQAFERGVRLLSALTSVADTWLPEMLYAKSAKRVVRRMVSLLAQYRADSAGDIGKPIEDKPERTEAAKPLPTSASSSVSPHKPSPASLPPTLPTSPPETVPPRPRHIDQYAHLLPRKTQEMAAQYGPLMRELDAAREKVRLLMNSDEATARDREAWAKRVAKLDATLGNIKRELDAGWEELVRQGRIVIDDLGMAHVADSHEENELDPTQQARRKKLRKWLLDLRRGNTPGQVRERHIQKWHETFREYVTLEGAKAFDDPKILESAARYGIELKKED